MKKKYITIALCSLFYLFVGHSVVNAQADPFIKFGGTVSPKDTVKKKTVWESITKTPWIIQFGPDIVDDNDTRLHEFKIWDDRNYYPIHSSAEKRIAKKWSIQTVLSTETVNPHNYGSLDLNAKYSFLTSSIADTKWFDPYGILGIGYTYRDFPTWKYKNNYLLDNALNANIGGGVNIWFFKNAGIYLQTVAKFDINQKNWGGSNYIQFSGGVVFKIGSTEVAKVIQTLPPSNYKRSKEAQDAIDYIHDILNK